jgi:hypothetical protein
MNTDAELLLREGLDRLTEGTRVPAGMAGRLLARRRRRRAAGYASAVVTAAAITVAGVAVAAGGPAGPAAAHPALATAYVVRRVEDAFANDNQVMRQTRSLDAPGSGGAGFFDGKLSSEEVTWAYHGRTSTEIFDANGQLQGIVGTGVVSGKLQGVEVDYIRHQWGLMPGISSGAPANACTSTGFLDAPGDPGTNWPSLIVRTLACGGYKTAGYADICGAETVKMTGSRAIGTGLAENTVTVTLFVSPRTYLPVQIKLYITAPGLHGSLTSYDIQWLPPTTANRARASVTVPCGYQQISWPSGNPASGQPSSACG